MFDHEHRIRRTEDCCEELRKVTKMHSERWARFETRFEHFANKMDEYIVIFKEHDEKEMKKYELIYKEIALFKRVLWLGAGALLAVNFALWSIGAFDTIKKAFFGG